MTTQQILEKAIQKAIDGGFDGTKLWTVDFTARGAVEAIYRYRNPDYRIVIFNPDFAKSLWGDEYVTGVYYSDKTGSTKERDLNLWQYHLQQMVIADDPIKYLGDHLDG